MTYYQLQFDLTAKTNPRAIDRLLRTRQLDLPTTANPPRPQPIEPPPTPLLDKEGQPILDCPRCGSPNRVYFNGITFVCGACEQTYYQSMPEI